MNRIYALDQGTTGYQFGEIGRAAAMLTVAAERLFPSQRLTAQGCERSSVTGGCRPEAAVRSQLRERPFATALSNQSRYMRLPKRSC